MTERYGATKEEWLTLDLVLGLGADLLPVVSKPDSAISPQSNMKTLGKTPSIYNKSRKVAGIPDWTNYKATAQDIEKWSKEPDYGICIQTRHVRAIDIDIADHESCNKILVRIANILPVVVSAIRRRASSAKCLIAFRLAGELPKRVFKTDTGIVEALGDGQQFVGYGTHQSGDKYQWSGFTDFPTISKEEFDKLWAILLEEFSIETSEKTQDYKKRNPKQESVIIYDSIAPRLAPLSDKRGPDGQIYISCPWKSDHTTDNGMSETAYFPAGTRGYEQGHFKCLHAHCAGRTDDEFMDKLGITIASPDEFDALPVVVTHEKESLPGFTRSQKGVIDPTLDNLYIAFSSPHVCLRRIGYDNFKGEIMTCKVNCVDAWESLKDTDYGWFKKHLERDIGFKPTLPLELIRLAVRMVAEKNEFDSAITWINSLKWDGVARVDGFMRNYMRSENTPYATAVSRYIWSALAGRVLVPGIKADMVPIFESDQGTFKSTTIECFAPDPKFFVAISFDEKNDDLARKMRGKVVAEIPELGGLRTKELESIKAFITKTHEEWVPKYQEHTVQFARRLVMFGTTNDNEILADNTGNRRWLPIRTEIADIDAIKRDRDQLWAEGRELFNNKGVCFRDAELLSVQVHKNYETPEIWHEDIVKWIFTRDKDILEIPVNKGYVTLTEIMQFALKMDIKNMKGYEAKRVASVLKKMKFTNKVKTIDGHSTKIWECPSELLPGADLI